MRTTFAFPLLLIAMSAAGAMALHAQTAPSQPRTAPDVASDVQPTGPPVSLADLIAEALQQNPDLLALRRDVDVRRQRSAQARSLDAPMFETQVWQWPINSLNPADANMYMFMFTQALPGSGKRDLRATVADRDVAVADSDVAVRALDVVAQMKQAYASLFVARRAIDVQHDGIALLSQIADASESKYAAGRISQQDVLKAVVELSRLHADLITFEEQALLAAARINVLRDRPPQTTIGPLAEPTEVPTLPATEDLQRLAIEHQPVLARARAEIAMAEAELASTRSDSKPDFKVQGGYMLMPRMTDAWTATFGISWPNAPWARSGLDARVAERTAAVTAARARAQALENAVRLSVQEAYLRARSAQDRAALLRTTILPQARQTIDVSRVAYQADRGDFQALIDSERVVLATSLDYVRALSDLTQALADLDRAVGTDISNGGH